MRRNTQRQTLEEFTADTLPVERIVGSTPPSDGSDAASSGKIPVALLDLTKWPDIDLNDLARLLLIEGDSSNVFAWDMAETPDDVLIRLTCAYETSGRGQFALLFRYSQHREFLRWVLEHHGVVPIADKAWPEHRASETPLLLCTTDDGFVYRLRLLRIHHLLLQEQRTPDVEAMVKILFEVRRYLSYGELATFASEVLKIPVQGTDSEHFPDAFRGPDAALYLQQISREFHVLLLRVMLVDGVTSGFSQKTVYFFTEDWLAEHSDGPPWEA